MMRGRRSKKTKKKKNHSYLGHRDALSVCAAMCLSKAMSLTRFKRKKAGGELRVQREMLKVFFTLARWAAG